MKAPELLKQQMPLVRMIRDRLESLGYQVGTKEYEKIFGHSLAFHRRFGEQPII